MRPHATRSSRIARLISIRLAAVLAPLFLLLQQTSAAETAPTADDWFTMNKDYSAQRYVDLDQITPANVAGLREVCEVALNQPVIFNSGLLMAEGTLYVATNRQTVAVDAATCALRWRHVLDFNSPPVNTGTRGLGYLNGKVFRGTTDGRVIAFDAMSGKVLWDVQASDPKKSETFPSAPIAWQGKVFIGIAYSEAGIAGRLLALDAATGKELWRFDTTLGFNSGGGFWSSYSLDPTTGEVFGGVANPYPDWNRDVTPNDIAGTALTDSVISVDAATGRLNWHYQVVPHDEHDWDLATTPTLYRASSGRDLVAIAGKDGRVHGIDRTARAIVFNTPVETLENDSVPVDNTWKHVCPGVQGGAMFNGAAYHPALGMLFVGVADHCTWYIKDKKAEGGGTPVKDWPSAAKRQAPEGWIAALDGETGAILWRYRAESQVLAGLVPTRGGLLFGGDTHGNLLVFNAKDGKLLKRIDAGGALNNGLISYSAGGAQYVAATVGGATENPSTVAGALRVVVYGLGGPDMPTAVTLDRVPPSAAAGLSAGRILYVQACSQCHGNPLVGGSAPPLMRQSQLADPELLKSFLASVPPPMPHLYPSVLNDDDVRLLAEWFRTDLFKCSSPDALQSCEAPRQPASGGTKEWQAIYSVLTSPRCMNCHPVVSAKLPLFLGLFPQDYPRQGDDRHPHYYTVVRGDTVSVETAEKTGAHVEIGMGAPFERCTMCHGASNDETTGIPGVEDPAHPGESMWALAPASMALESSPGVPLTGPQLCARLKDKSRNGNRELADTLHHIATEPLILWSWNPGKRLNGETRTTPPVSHDDFVLDFSKWMDDGAPCPSE
jgi:outer membrane protein assembly factor BamB